MSRRTRTALIAVSLATLAGCCGSSGSQDLDDPVGACAIVDSQGLCYEYSDGAFGGATREVLQGNCDAMRGTWRASCPGSSRQGICTVPDGSRQIYYPTFDVHCPDRTVEEHCFATGGVLSY